MKTRIMAAAWALAAAMLSGNIAAQTASPYLTSSENLSKVQVGVTNATQVRALLGEPLRMTKDARRAWDGWQYRVLAYGQRNTLWISFSSDGVVREVVQLPEYRSAS